MPEKPVRTIAWADQPPPDDGVLVEIRRPGPGENVYGVVVCPKLVGAMVHYAHGRTTPCTGEEATCEGCVARSERRWKGYLGCWDQDKGRLFLGEVTKESVKFCEKLKKPPQTLRGERVRITRCGKTANSRVRVTFLDPRCNLVLPEPFDMQAALEKIWFGAQRKRPRSEKAKLDRLQQKVEGETAPQTWFKMPESNDVPLA